MKKYFKISEQKTTSTYLYLFLSQGSYRCGGCRPGFIGNPTSGCLSVEDMKRTPWICPDGSMCHQNGECVRSTTGKFSCEVSLHDDV